MHLSFTSLYTFLALTTFSTHTLKAENQKTLLKGAIHVHSLRSFDSKGTFEEIKKAAKLASLDFVIMTDHVATKKKGLAASLPFPNTDLLLIDGVEVKVQKSDFLVIGNAVSQINWQEGHEFEGIKTAKPRFRS